MFRQKLNEALSNFDLTRALTLSDSIHEAEVKGNEISKSEGRLWEKLTVKIEEARGNV